MKTHDPAKRLLRIAADAGLDFVTVTFGADLRMLQMQARSLGLYLPPNLVNSINIVINNDEPGVMLRLMDDIVLPLYGVLSDKVRVWTRQEITGDYSFIHQGWFSQQILKLMISQHLSAAGYIILDSKNHFVRAVVRADFISNDGRLLHRSQDLSRPIKSKARFWARWFRGTTTFELPRRFIGTFRYFGLIPEEHAACVVPKTTPFPVLTTVAKEMIQSIEEKEAIYFPRWFENYFEATEFYLLQAFPTSRGYVFTDYYCPAPTAALAIYPDKPDMEKRVRTLIRKMQEPRYFSFALHRASREKLSPTMRRLLLDFWRSRKLIPDDGDAYFFQSKPPHEIHYRMDV